MTTLLYTHPDCLAHDTGPGHPERSARLKAVLDALADEDFRVLDDAIAESAGSYREYAIVLARLTHAAARAKGFDRQIEIGRAHV